MKKHNFLRRVVRLCLVMMVLITLIVEIMAVVTGQSIDPAALGVLMGGWCGELLLTLLKRRWEVEDKEKEKEETDDS